MKNFKYHIIIFCLFLYSYSSSKAQCGTTSYLDSQIVPYLDIDIFDLNGNPVSFLQPSTDYCLSVRATRGACGTPGSGCNYVSAPVASRLIYGYGFTFYGSVPSASNPIGLDMGSGNNYTVCYRITTLSPGNFGGQIITVVDVLGLVNCAVNASSTAKSFSFQ